MVVYLGDKAVGLGFVAEKEVPKIKYGASIDLLLGNINENGELQRVTERFDLVFDGVKGFSDSTLYNKFRNLSNLRNIYFPDLTSITANSIREAFSDSSAKGFYAPKLQTITGSTTAYVMCGRTQLEHLDLAALKTVTGAISMGSAFQQTKLTKVHFYSLTRTDANSFAYAGSTNGIFQGCTLLTEIHFRMDAQAVIEKMQNYGNKWGATNATIYFDLVGTITVDGVEYARKEVDTIRVNWERVWVAWESTGGNIIYTSASGEPAVGTAVYSDAGITQVGTVSGVA